MTSPPRIVRRSRTTPGAAAHVCMSACGLLVLATVDARAASITIAVSAPDGALIANAVALLEPDGTRAAVKPMADVTISQMKSQFVPRVTLITTGTRVTFPNFDTVRHHVYSFSPIKTFELKLYAGVPGVPVMFDKPGVAVIGCNIHDAMSAWVVVADTPWSARSDASGRARIEGVPPGHYKLRLWHPGLSANAEPAAVSITVGGADIEHQARLAVQPIP